MTKQLIYCKNKYTKLAVYKASNKMPILVCSDYNLVMNAMFEDLHSPYKHIRNQVVELIPLMQMTGLFQKVLKEAKTLGLL